MRVGRRNMAKRRSPAGHASILAALVVGGVGVALLGAGYSPRQAQPGTRGLEFSPDDSPQVPDNPRTVLDTYCVVCHNEQLYTAGIAFDVEDVETPSTNPEVWERVIRRLRTGTMPPPGIPRPDLETYDGLASWLERDLDRAWLADPNPGRMSAVHRLNRTEYNNAIRDLLAVEVDVTDLLPGDETADGSFDNLAAALSITTTHLDRYMSVARYVTRLGVGLPPTGPGGQTFDISLHLEQDDRVSEDLPLGSRGGIAIPYHFPVDGEYRIRVLLRRQYVDYIVGLGWPQELDFRIDGSLVKRLTVGGDAPAQPAVSGGYVGSSTAFGPTEWEVYMHNADASLEAVVSVQAGSRVVGVSFVRELWEPESIPQPEQRGRVLANDEFYMGYAAVLSVEVTGPYEVSGLAEETPSRQEIFVCHPRLGAEEQACATQILSRMARRAYRRPATDLEVQSLLDFFDAGREDGGSFDSGIQFALERLLVSTAFLLRVYRDPAEVGPGEAYRLSDLELASRLSFFLWSSIPDERLLDLAEGGQLRDPEILEQEVRRMLADPRAIDALVNDFAAQWLNLLRVPEVVADPVPYPHFDENLLEAFQRETELFVGSTLREDRSVLDLLRADYTYVNERLARHYGIPGVYGYRFRRVTLPDLEQRGGLLAHGSVLSVSSYPNRTSPVLRGKWLLDNIIGMTPPPPPPDVDTNLEEVEGGFTPSIRERLAQHRDSPVCSSCHGMIDPPGFALENFDAIGGWRTADEAGNPIDAVATMSSGVEVQGFAGLRAYLLDQPDQFVGTVAEKLMTYALGRRLEHYDRPAVRQIVRDAAVHDYRWSSVILGIVQSPPFLMRTAPVVAD